MVNIEKGPLGAFEEHALARLQGAVENAPGVIDIGLQALAPLAGQGVEFGHVHRLAPVVLGEFEVPALGDLLEFLEQAVRGQQVGDPHAPSRHFILVGGPDAPARGADARFPGSGLPRLIEGLVPRQNHVGSPGDP